MNHSSKSSPVARTVKLAIPFLLSLLVYFPAKTKAENLYYDFIGIHDDVLATLELTSLPATHTEVAGLTFTPAGEVVFKGGPFSPVGDGFFGPGLSYAGSFDSSTGMFVDDGDFGLTFANDGPAQFFDMDPPGVDLIPQLATFFLDARPEHRNDALGFFFEEPWALGNWRLVTASSSLLSGDFNDDNFVGNDDLTLLLDNWGASIPPIPDGWVQNYSTPSIGNDELVRLLDEWGGIDRLPSQAAIPEPTTLALVLTLTPLLLRRRKR